MGQTWRMAVETVSGLPAIIESGDTVIFTEDFTDYPVSAWGVKLYVSLNGTAVTNWTGSGSGSTYTFTLTAAQTAALTAGRYLFAFYATETATSQRELAKTGELDVLPNLAATQTASTAQTLLTNIETAITALSSGENQSVSFNGQSFTKKDLGGLLRQRTQLQAEVIREKRRADALRGIRRSNCIAPIFTNP